MRDRHSYCNALDMTFRAPTQPMLLTALLTYTVIAGVIGAAQSARARREARIQRWNDVFRGRSR
jgi:hypothetical protein